MIEHIEKGGLMRPHLERDHGIDFTLVPAPDEPQVSDLQQQQGRMSRLPLEAPLGRLPSGRGLGASSGGLDIRAGAGGAHVSDIHIMLAAAGKTGPTFGAALIAWVHGRVGRKIRLKVGDVEAEAGNAKEIKKLLEEALAYKQANEPKRIHER